MRLLTLTTVGVIALAILSGTAGAHSVADSQFLHGFPVNYAPALFPCNPGSLFQGLNGYWYPIASFTQHRFLLTAGDPLDTDPYFYDVTCKFINNGGAAMGGIGVPESGTIPANAAWMLVWAKAGTGTYQLDVID